MLPEYTNSFWSMGCGKQTGLSAPSLFEEILQEHEEGCSFVLCSAWGCSPPHTESDSLMVVSMRSMTTKRPVGESQLLLFALPKSMLAKETLKPIWEIICWSLEAMVQGKWPSKAPPHCSSYKLRNAGELLMESGKRGMVPGS